MTDTDDSAERKLLDDMLAMLPRLRRFAYGLTGSASEGDDLVQITFEKAMRARSQWQPGSRLDSWLFRIAQNAFRNELRSRGRHAAYLQAVEPHQVSAVDGRTIVDDRARFASLRAALGRLPDEQRVALLLVAIGNHSYAETAGILELPIGTVMSRISRARRALRGMLDERPEPNSPQDAEARP
ncbi:RNA polymerase sigma factor [Oceanibacterium hippocampi]|uniref:RNA polymerase sigma factor n=1 Tax=Oceanibacterium hippocampi TaxID=745714 RepID=UPI001594A1A8|nr:RNA polymerase sigma factor [Oceanibacterium hippocampi]